MSAATMIEIMLFPWLTGLAIAAISGPLGNFVVWRRMAYFGDTLAHSALVGVALALAFSLNLTAMILVVSMALAFLLTLLGRITELTSDTLLGIFSHGMLAIGLILLSLFSTTRVDLMSFLFGDILTAGIYDVLVTASLATMLLVVLIIVWKKLLSVCVDEALAKVEGLPVFALQLLMVAMVACVIALAMKIVGILLITALLIIPSAAARALSRSPEAMAMIASAIGMCSVSLGLVFSFFVDAPTGPSIIVAALLFFALCQIISAVRDGGKTKIAESH